MADQGVLKNKDRAIGWAGERAGCWDCPHWQRRNAATGHCGPAGGHPGWLTSYIYICPAHPAEKTSGADPQAAYARKGAA